MAVFHPQTVKCECGNTLTVQLADSVNVKRSPESRDKILRGEFHRVACPACNRQMTVEKPFYYTDLNRNAFFKVFPRGERHLWRSASKELDTAASLFPETLSGPGERTLRVLFGMDELREKLLAQDAGIDDRLVELLKVFLVYEHPVLLRRARLRLSLDAVTGEGTEFTANYEHHQQRFRLSIPGEIVNNIAEKPDRIKAWVKKAHPNSNIFEEPDHWVNMWRWSPQPTALERLKSYAEQVRQGEQIDATTISFQQMLEQLPRGNHLPGWAKQDLRSLFEFAKANNIQQLEDKLFEIRFEIELEDDWSANNDPDDIDTLWKLLKDLPDTNVEGNTKIHEILLDVGGTGGVYSPQSFDISIGSQELSNRERFEDVMRHEVGHAVHEMKADIVNRWLETQFGWHIFGTTDAEIDQWVGLMGGWGDLTDAQQKEVRQYLIMAVGDGGSWTPGPTPSPPAGHPWYKPDFAPRLAFEKTGARWFQHNMSWHRANGKAFFLNFWYQTFMAVDTTTLDLIAQMPDSYASMSHFEFFAELYALYYDLDDPKRPVIPANVATWIDTNIGAPEQAAPMPAAPLPKREWETVTRPRGSTGKKK
jgi:hypothetical protein